MFNNQKIESNLRWSIEVLSHRIERLELENQHLNAKIEENNKINKVNYSENFGLLRGETKHISVNDAIKLILNYLNLDIQETPSKIELVPKDDK